MEKSPWIGKSFGELNGQHVCAWWIAATCMCTCHPPTSFVPSGEVDRRKTSPFWTEPRERKRDQEHSGNIFTIR